MNAPALRIATSTPIEAEYAILGKLVSDNRRIDAVADIITQEDFADPFFGHIFGLIVSEYSQGRPANPVTLRPLLISHPSFAEIGGDAFLAQLQLVETLIVPAVATAKQIAATARKRRLIEGLTESAAIDGTAEQIIDAADQAIVTAAHSATSAIEMTGAACVDRLVKAYEQPKHGVKCTIIEPLDSLLGPLRRKQLVIMAGRPGMGKTACALSYALGAAQGGHGVLFISLEMGGEELAGRMSADLSFTGRSGVPLDDILADNPTRATIAATVDAADRLRDMPLSIVDTGKMTLGRLNMIVRRHKRRMAAKGEALELVVVDYLQLLSTDDRSRSNYETVSEISRTLKAIAKDNDVAILALAQLSREVEKRQDKRPQLSDLRDSGQIEQDADAVLFLVRPEYYLRTDEPAKHDPKRAEWEQALAACENEIEFICAKRRNGRTGTAKGHFYARFQAVRG